MEEPIILSVLVLNGLESPITKSNACVSQSFILNNDAACNDDDDDDVFFVHEDGIKGKRGQLKRGTVLTRGPKITV